MSKATFTTVQPQTKGVVYHISALGGHVKNLLQFVGPKHVLERDCQIFRVIFKGGSQRFPALPISYNLIDHYYHSVDSIIKVSNTCLNVSKQVMVISLLNRFP